ncbi:MAG: SsrA-binding protein [Alteromonadaceae bacterium]|nr:MAG: SsrA-binding protein [Alteromonadaceae bacterium]
MSKKKKPPSNNIAQNKRARHDYFLEEKFEAGLVLSGWEVKALRAGKGQLTESYVIMKDGEAWLLGAQIQPLPQASTHFVTDPNRARKLLLHAKELAKIKQATEQKGHTIVATSIYWKQHLVKCQIALAKGKQQHDKRQSEKERDWSVQKQRVLRDHAK